MAIKIVGSLESLSCFSRGSYRLKVLYNKRKPMEQSIHLTMFYRANDYIFMWCRWDYITPILLL